MTPERLAREAAEQHIAEVIDLRNPGYDDKGRRTVNTGEKIQLEDNALQAAGIRHVSLPATQIPDDYTVDRFLAEIETAGSRPVLIHCDHGIGRTGLFIALYLMEYAGYSNEDARHCVSRYYSLRLHGRKHFAPDFNKGKYIIDYSLRHKRPHSGGKEGG
jgi:protein tyrosine/serine phosphatase